MIKSNCIISCKTAILRNSDLKDNSASCVIDLFLQVFRSWFDDRFNTCFPYIICHMIMQFFCLLMSPWAWVIKTCKMICGLNRYSRPMLHPDAPKGHPNDPICFVNLSVISADWPHLGFFSRYTFFRKYVTLQRRGEAMIFFKSFCAHLHVVSTPTYYWLELLDYKSYIHNNIHISWCINISLYIIIYHLLFFQNFYLTSSYSILLKAREVPGFDWLDFCRFSHSTKKCWEKGKGPETHDETLWNMSQFYTDICVFCQVFKKKMVAGDGETQMWLIDWRLKNRPLC